MAVSGDKIPLRMRELEQMPSRRSQITETLRAAIIAGEMHNGVVYSAPALAREFGVSPTPVREAMLHLAKEGLIEIARNKGFRVVEPSDRDIEEITELRMLIEVPTVGKIARVGASAAVLRKLDARATRTVEAARAADITGHVVADMAFHLDLLGLSGNEHLVEIVRTLRSKSRLFGLRAPEKTETLRESTLEHAELVDFVRKREPEEAEALLSRHIQRALFEWRRNPAA